MCMRVSSPSPGSGPPQWKVTWSPGLAAAAAPCRTPMRGLGAGRSCRIAAWRPARPAASRTRCATSACSSAEPWEKFSRATSMPASTMRTRTSGSREAGPMVATILVRRMCLRSADVDVLRQRERAEQPRVADAEPHPRAEAEGRHLALTGALERDAEAPVAARLEALDHLDAPARDAAGDDHGLDRLAQRPRDPAGDDDRAALRPDRGDPEAAA